MKVLYSEFNFDYISRLYIDKQGVELAWPNAAFPVVKQDWQEWFDESDYQKVFSLYLVDNDKILGHMAVKKYKMYPGLCYLCFIYVDQRERGRGLGKKLVEESCAFLYENFDLDEVYLLVDPQNTQAIHCYESAGFRRFDIQNEKLRYMHVRKN